MKKIRWTAISLLIVTGLVGCKGADSKAGLWPQWRGVGGTGISSEIGLPTEWSEDEGIRWNLELPGTGTSSPIVGHENAYVTLVSGSAKSAAFALLAVGLADGEIAWRTDLFERRRGRTHRLNTPAGSTPATDGEHIFAYFGSHLAAVDLEGGIVWVEEIDEEYLDRSRYGAGSSLILVDDKVIVFQDRERVADEVGWLAAYSKATGERLWRVEWDHTCCAYTTPLELVTRGHKQIFIGHAREVAGYDPDTGEKLWTRPQEMNQPVASPVIEGDLMCTSSGAHGERETVCRRISHDGDDYVIEDLWRTKKYVPGTPSPVLHQGRLYIVTEKGIAVCFNAETGERLWRERLPGRGFNASLVLGDGKIYAAGHDTVAVIAAAPEFELLADNPLPHSGVVASPALAAGCLLVRSQRNLMCIEGTAGTS